MSDVLSKYIPEVAIPSVFENINAGSILWRPRIVNANAFTKLHGCFSNPEAANNTMNRLREPKHK